MKNISLRQLRYFDAVARHLHFGRAAEECAITQPALSMQIQELEREIGAPLLERTRQGARLTPEGAQVAGRVAKILADVGDLGDFTQQSAGLFQRGLRLGIIPTIAPYMLPELLPLIRNRLPGLDLQLREAQTQYLISDLAAGQLDVLLLALPIQHASIETEALFIDRFVLALPDRRRSETAAYATPDLFSADRLLLLEEGHCFRDQALSVCGIMQPEGLNTLGMVSLSTIVQMVANGFGVTLLPEMSIKLECGRTNLHLLPFPDPKPHRVIGLAWRRSSARKRDFHALGRLILELRGEMMLSSSFLPPDC